MKKTIKNTKGVTLIVLVITIIVLLILAGVSIATLSGQDGILTKATEAKEKTEDGEEKEKLELAISTAVADGTNGYGVLTDAILRAEVTKQFGSNEKLEGTGPWTYEGERKKYKIQTSGKMEETVKGVPEVEEGTLVWMFQQAQKDGCTNDDGMCTNANHLHIGDYLNYIIPTSGECTSIKAQNGYSDQLFNICESDEKINWQVLGLDTTGENMLLIADSPVKRNGENTRFYLYGAIGEANAIIELDNICKMYKNEYAQEGRAVNAEDINKLCGVTVDYENKKLIGNDGKTELKGGYGDNGYAYTFMTTATLENSYTIDYESKKKVGPGKYTFNGNSYSYDARIEATNTSKKQKLLDLILFGRKGYWLATQGIYVSENWAAISVGAVTYYQISSAFTGDYTIFNSHGHEDYLDFYIRPVISLQKNVTIKQIAKE